MITQISFPYPPSVNRWTRALGRGRVVLTKEARDYKASIEERFDRMNLPVPFYTSEPLAVVYEVHPPDRRRRDLSNILKVLEDSLNGYLWTDDSQIKAFLMVMMSPIPSGRVDLIVQPLEILNKEISAEAILDGLTFSLKTMHTSSETN